ncbi:16663_t:CDS:2 [Gigaspora margarita]|uniref:16663_t:CDS:1 n=1 Tax=Gigaspora margarita TaxID=4874 RepID=A0ABN7VWE6_GIGMA|nr:16663_t:CDS:2 [Gigaspora margarita]
MDQISLDIDTGNTKVHIPVTKEKLTIYTLWDLPRLFNNGQVKRLIRRYGKVPEIRWTCGKFSKQAHIILSKKNEKSKKMLEDSWVLPIEKRLTRITVGDNQKEDLKIRKQYKLTLYGLLGNTAEVLLLRQVRHLKAKAVYIPAESKNNPIQQEGAETSSRYKSEIKEKMTTRFIKKDKNRTGRKTLELGNYTVMKPKWKHTSKENDNATKNLNTRRMIYKNNLSNKNEEKSSHSKNENLNATLQEILNRLKKIESSYSSSRAIATPDTGRVHKKTQGANLKGKEKEHLMDDVEYMIKDRCMRINKAEESRKMKTSEDYQISKEWAAYIIQASTKDMDLVTNSDHKLLITALDTGINTRFRSHAETRKKGKRRLVFELEKATKNDWVHYKGKLEKLLLSKIHIDKEISMDEE